MTVTDPSLDPWNALVRAGEVPPVSEDALLAARVAVRRAATTETLPARVAHLRRRRRLRYAIALGAAASIVAAGAVTVQLGDHEVGGSPAAAAVFERAAQVALAQHDLVVGPGQFLRIATVQQSWGAAYDRHGKVRIVDGRPAVYEERWTRTIWIPHDIDADWTVRQHSVALRDPAGIETPSFPSTTRRDPSWARSGSSRHLYTYDPDWYASLPRDPQALLRAIRTEHGGEGSGMAYEFEEGYSEVLRSGLAPASVRSALFSALAQSPDMVVEEGVTTPTGHDGIAIGARGRHFQMIFDTATGAYVGDRGTDPDFPDVPGLDADKTTMLTSVRTTVVDHAPPVRTLSRR